MDVEREAEEEERGTSDKGAAMFGMREKPGVAGREAVEGAHSGDAQEFGNHNQKRVRERENE